MASKEAACRRLLLVQVGPQLLMLLRMRGLHALCSLAGRGPLLMLLPRGRAAAEASLSRARQQAPLGETGSGTRSRDQGGCMHGRAWPLARASKAWRLLLEGLRWRRLERCRRLPGGSPAPHVLHLPLQLLRHGLRLLESRHLQLLLRHRLRGLACPDILVRLPVKGRG